MAERRMEIVSAIRESTPTAERRMESAAASQLSTWTDSDTAMQIVGTSLGVFGASPLDPTVVLSNETPLRNALFDVLLSLVEGGALEMHSSDDGRHAFRWRGDIAVAGLSRQGSTTIDVVTPSPFSAELVRARAERDEALERANVAEALAAERERLLRVLVDEMYHLFLENPHALPEGWRDFFADYKPSSRNVNDGP